MATVCLEGGPTVCRILSRQFCSSEAADSGELGKHMSAFAGWRSAQARDIHRLEAELAAGLDATAVRSVSHPVTSCNGCWLP